MGDSSLIVKIGANLKDFNKKMMEVNKKIKDAFSTSQLKQFALRTIATQVALRGLATYTVKVADNYQQASIAFEKLIGNKKAARIFTDQLTDFAYSTPFDYDGLMKNAQALYQVGVAGNQIIPMLKAFSEAAAGIGKGQTEIDAMTKAIVHMQSIGEADVRTFESINRVGIPAWKMLAKAMNTTEQAAKDAVEKHMVSASQATEILVKGMNDMYSGMMKIQETKTFKGALDNLKGNVEHTVMEIGRIVSDNMGIIKGINKASDAFDTFAKTVRDESIYEALIKVFGPGMVGLIAGVGTAIVVYDIPAMVAFGRHMLETAYSAIFLRNNLISLTGAATAALGALAALIAYKASLGIDGFDVDYHPEGLSEEDEAAVNEAKATLKQAEARKKAEKAAKAAQDAKDAMALASKNFHTSGVGSIGGGSGGHAGGGYGKSDEDIERERRQKAMQTARDELSSFRAVQDAMRESIALRKAYMTAAESEAYDMRAQHEDAVRKIQDRWQEFEIAYIGMSDEERARTIENLDKVGAAYEITAEGRLSLTKQTAADIAAEEKRYAEESKNYYIQCKDLMAERDEAFRTNSLEALQAFLTEENAARLNAFNTQQEAMQRYYDNWLIMHRSTSEMITNAVLDSQSGFENFFTNILTGAKSFNDSLLDLFSSLLNSIVKQIAEMMAAKVVNQFLNWIMPGFFSAGGSVSSGGFNTYGAAANVMGISLGSFASGGAIIGPGSGTSDSIPAMLSNGEYVMSAGAVSKLGVPFLNSLNSGRMPRFAGGGYVGNISGNPGATGCNVEINIKNETGQPVQAQQTGSRFDGEKYVLDLILKFVNNNDGGLRTMIKGVAAT